MNRDISIIIPLFNAEKWISRTTFNVLKEKRIQFELLLIDDGSTDKTLSICREIEKKDDRVCVYHHSKHGVSYTRNRGIKMAKGKYVIFLDADDIVEPDFLFIMYNTMVKGSYDCICCNYSYEEENGTVLRFAKDTVDISLNSYEALLYTFSKEFFGGYLWNKVFSAEIIRKFNIYFDEHLSIYEDLYFVIKYISQCNSIRYISYCGYHYIKHASSAMNSISLENAYSKVLATFQISHLEIVEKNIKIKKMAESRLVYAYSDFEKAIRYSQKKDSRKIDDVQQYLRQSIDSVMRCACCSKTRKIKLFLCNFLGFSNIAKIYGFVKKKENIQNTCLKEKHDI